MRFAENRHARWLMLSPLPIWTWWYLATVTPGARWEDLFAVFWPLNAVGILLFFAGLIQWAGEGAPVPSHRLRGVPAGADERATVPGGRHAPHGRPRRTH